MNPNKSVRSIPSPQTKAVMPVVPMHVLQPIHVGQPVMVFPYPNAAPQCPSPLKAHNNSNKVVPIDTLNTEHGFTERSEPRVEQSLEYPHEFFRHRDPVLAKCPACGHAGETTVTFQVGDGTYITIIILCLLFVPVSLFPCCMESCQDAVHKCMKCGKVLGTSPVCS